MSDRRPSTPLSDVDEAIINAGPPSLIEPSIDNIGIEEPEDSKESSSESTDSEDTYVISPRKRRLSRSDINSDNIIQAKRPKKPPRDYRHSDQRDEKLQDYHRVWEARRDAKRAKKAELAAEKEKEEQKKKAARAKAQVRRAAGNIKNKETA